MMTSLIAQRLTEFKQLATFNESVREYVREDHLWLYAVIANPHMMVQRMAHWKRT